MTNSKNNQSVDNVKISTFRMGLFTTSKLIQNLGINRLQFKFVGNFRSIHGRD